MTKRVLLAAAILAAVLFPCTAPAGAQPVIVPSDIAVTLTAIPSANLSAGAPLLLAVTATNLGPQAVDTLVLESSAFTNQFDLAHASVTCIGFVISVADGVTGPAQFMNWYVAAVPLGTAPFAIGETRSCEIKVALSSSAPQAFSFSFGLAHEFVDVNPNNDSATVALRQAIPPIPTLPGKALVLLAGLLIAAAALGWRNHGP